MLVPWLHICHSAGVFVNDCNRTKKKKKETVVGWVCACNLISAWLCVNLPSPLASFAEAMMNPLSLFLFLFYFLIWSSTCRLCQERRWLNAVNLREEKYTCSIFCDNGLLHSGIWQLLLISRMDSFRLLYVIEVTFGNPILIPVLIILVVYVVNWNNCSFVVSFSCWCSNVKARS
jgi:hypothetical protein